ncbi:MAG: PPC domain-containing protein, partial [Cyanobacteria bacterium P01_D01_bin.50]
VLYAEPQLQNSIFDLNDPSAAPITLQPGESFQLGDDAAVTRTGNNFEISSTWENVSVNYLGFGGNGLFNIKLDRFMNQPVTGLLGNSNGNPNDDIALRDGTVIPPNKQTFNFLTTTFAESWQVPEEESLFENPIELAAPEQEVTIETLDPQLTETAFAIVEESDVEIPEEFVDEVAFDVALTLEGLGFEPGNNDPELEEIAGEIVTNLEGFFDDSDDLSPAQLTDESNDTIEEAISLPNDSGSYSYKGFIGDNPNVAPSDDVDLIKLELNQGGRAVIDINAREYGSALDSVLRVFDSTGNEVAFNDDSFVTPDSYRDSFIDFTAPVSDTYYVGVSSYHNFEYNPFTEGSGKGYTTGEYDISISIENPTAMGETGSISNLTHTAQTINLSRNYLNPVVFAQPLSYNGTAPATVRLDNITSNSFTVSVQEPSNENGIHGAENLSFMVLEAGNWELADGTVLEVGTTQSSQLVANGFETVNFDADFDSTPVVMSQVQTLNGTDFVRTRQDDITQSGFLVGMEEEEANATSGHANETIGYMAMSGGSGNWSGLNYIADYTGDIVTHAWETVNFGAGFTQAPQLLASLASYDGADAAGIRYDSLGSSSVQFKVEEDTSFDSEMLHTTENVSFLAIEGSGILEAFVI